MRAFYQDPKYNEPMPEMLSDEWVEIMRVNVWQAAKSAIAFMTAFAYLNPYIENFQNPWL